MAVTTEVPTRAGTEVPTRAPYRVIYCPVHEYERDDCDEWCAPRRDELRRLDNALRAYWFQKGYSFHVRGRG